jgi:hypothetical protein
MHPPKATSVTAEGRADGYTPPLAYYRQVFPGGSTRVVVSAPAGDLARVHRALVSALAAPLGILWRQKIDRRNPRPEGAPPRDHVALELSVEEVLSALATCELLLYHDARGELWIRDRFDAQIVLDDDGLIFAYPDDPTVRDALDALGVEEREVKTIADRDYVKHWYRAQADAQEDELVLILGMQRVK